MALKVIGIIIKVYLVDQILPLQNIRLRFLLTDAFGIDAQLVIILYRKPIQIFGIRNL